MLYVFPGGVRGNCAKTNSNFLLSICNKCKFTADTGLVLFVSFPVFPEKYSPNLIYEEGEYRC